MRPIQELTIAEAHLLGMCADTESVCRLSEFDAAVALGSDLQIPSVVRLGLVAARLRAGIIVGNRSQLFRARLPISIMRGALSPRHSRVP